MKELASVKPGRKLIKALSQFKDVIYIKRQDNPQDKGFAFTLYTSEGKKTEYAFQIKIGADNSECYAGLSSENCRQAYKTPNWVAFGHELTHAYQALSAFSIKKGRNPLVHYPQYFPEDSQEHLLGTMYSLQEQYAITGWNFKIFQNNDYLTQDDFLCENAFLIAPGLPPRVAYTCKDKSGLAPCAARYAPRVPNG